MFKVTLHHSFDLVARKALVALMVEASAACILLDQMCYGLSCSNNCFFKFPPNGSAFTAVMTSFRELEWSNEMSLLVFLELQNGNAEVTIAQMFCIHLYSIQKYSHDKSVIY